MKFTLTLIAALVLAGSGCFGLPSGSADTGDTITIQYTAYDAETGAVLRANRTATFLLGSGASGLGLGLERAVRGHLANETFDVRIARDASLDFTTATSVARTLASIPMIQDAPRSEFDNSQFGPATVGKEFPAYGIYTGVVTEVTDSTATFEIRARDGQEDPVPSVGCILVSHVGDGEILRELKPVVGSVFVIQPPSIYQTSTPLGLAPGSYKVLGSTADKIDYGFTTSTALELLGKNLDFRVTVLRVVPGTTSVGPVGNDYGVRDSPQVNGDPNSIAMGQSADGHTSH